MGRKFFTLAAGVSAVGCVCVCVLWGRGYRTGSEGARTTWPTPGEPWTRSWTLSLGRGSVVTGRRDDYGASHIVNGVQIPTSEPPNLGWSYRVWSESSPTLEATAATSVWQWLGFAEGEYQER